MASSTEFLVHSANVTGLGNKAPLFDGTTPAVWCVQETHLTAHGQRAFMKNVNYRARGLQSGAWKAAWGHPCPPRAGGILGGATTGTAILAKQPIRDMTHFIPEPQRLTSRCTCATTRLGTMWMVMASIYGFAKGANHQDHLEDTDWLLQPMADLLLPYTNRPALLGDALTWLGGVIRRTRMQSIRGHIPQWMTFVFRDTRHALCHNFVSLR